MATPGVMSTVAVVHGIHRLTLPLAGRAVGGVRHALAPVLNIGAEAMAVVNGIAVGEDYVLAPDDHLEFVRLAGEKGRGGRPCAYGVNHTFARAKT
jgi:hypothetical protein